MFLDRPFCLRNFGLFNVWTIESYETGANAFESGRDKQAASRSGAKTFAVTNSGTASGQGVMGEVR